jgi:hypothetical protein
VQGRYDDVFPKGSKLRRGGAIDQDHEGRWIHMHIVDRGSEHLRFQRQDTLVVWSCDPRYPDDDVNSVGP